MGEGKLMRVLKQNLELLRDRQPDKWLAQVPMGKKTGVGTSTWRRALGVDEASNDITVSSVEKIAAYFRIEPWRLLTPRLGETPAALRPVSLEIAEMLDAISDPELQEAATARAYFYARRPQEAVRRPEAPQPTPTPPASPQKQRGSARTKT
jgi:hypothetical protein